MANKTISMVQIRRIIQLKAQGLSKNKISEQLNIHRKTLGIYLSRIEATGKELQWLSQYSEEQLRTLVFTAVSVNLPDFRLDKLTPLFEYFRQELPRPGVTRKTLWEEYQRSNADSYGYTQFCEHLSRYMQRSEATMHLSHKAGDFLQVDFAGNKLQYIDTTTGEIISCPVLVCTLAYSGYAYVEALPDARQAHLFDALNRCLEYLGGVPLNVLSDNMKQFITKNNRYEYAFSELAQQWSAHYNTNLDATRPRKPKDKPTVENGVYLSYLRIYAKLRNEEFYSIEQLNQRIRQLLGQHNQTPFQKLPGSRHERFLQHEQAILKPLPIEAFSIKHVTQAKVQKNYHVILGEDRHQYSVPYQHIGQTTKIIYDTSSVEVFIGHNRIATHRRDMRQQGYSTLDEHMPEQHRKYRETQGWDANYFLAQAAKIGPNSIDVFKKILASRDFVEQTYKACLGLKRLSDIYGAQRFEAASTRIMTGSRVTYGMMKNILENNLDKQLNVQLGLFSLPEHENIRGSLYYN